MFQKALIIGSLSYVAFSINFAFSHVAGVVGALQKGDEGIQFTEMQISLIAITMSLTCIIGYGLAAAVTDKVGRRWTYIIFSITMTINWTIIHHAREMYQFMLSRIIGGISIGALLSLNIFVTSEYTSPKTRVFFLNIVTTMVPAIGIGTGHTIGIVLHWRTVALFGIFVSVLGVILPYFWVESPHWLASKGRIEECETVFRVLHGSRPNSERELELLIRLETTKLKAGIERNRKTTLKRLAAAFKRKYFWKLLLLNIVMDIYYTATGRYIFNILATVILKDITGTSDVLLFTLLLDGFMFIGSSISCFLVRKTSVRTLLFSSGFSGTAVLGLFSIFYYFRNGQTYFNWINVTLLALYFIISYGGTFPIIDALFSEMFPLELKVYVYFMSGIITIGSFSVTVILLPHILASMGYHGFFLMNVTIMSLCLGYIWLMLPETKGKTLQEIEMYFKTNNFNVDEVLSSEQMKTLV